MKPSDLHEFVARCSVRIAAGGQHRGTGFFVAPGMVLTAAHLVAPPLKAGLPLSTAWSLSLLVPRSRQATKGHIPAANTSNDGN